MTGGDFRVGDRVVLEFTDDPWTKLNAGDEGTVTFVDHYGTLHVRWDSGSSLGLVPGHDRYHRALCAGPLVCELCDECGCARDICDHCARRLAVEARS